jgi:ribosomal protein S18 acetylase RimI-like enzyme
MNIRRVEPEDAKAIAKLWQALSDYHVEIDPRMPTTTSGAANRYASRMIERRDDPYTRTFVAEVDGQVVGYILGAVLDLHPDLFQHVEAGFIADIFVDSAYRQQGIARKLVDTMSEWFVSEGVQHIEWQVAAANESGIRFWEAIGGKAMTIRMRKTLGNS